MSENNYNGADISDVVNVDNNDRVYYSFRLKNKIKVYGNYDKKNICVESIITANKDADINDIVNCCILAINGNSSSIDRADYKEPITKAIENKGSKIDIPIEKGSLKIVENSVEANDDSISIHVLLNY